MRTDKFGDLVGGMSRFRNMFLAVLISAGLATCFLRGAGAQTASPQGSKAPSKAPAKAPAAGGKSAPAAGPEVEADLAQLMRGILYPSSNVVFAAQDDLKKWTPAADPSVSPNPLTSTYGGWQAVENASLAIAESANLIILPGRVCSNGKPVPVKNADWQKYAQALRKAGLNTYKAAQTKSMDAMTDAAGEISEACDGCHGIYREKPGGVPDRCVP